MPLRSSAFNITLILYYYGLSVISVTVTKGGHPKGSRLYGTSETIKQGVTKSHKKFST